MNVSIEVHTARKALKQLIQTANFQFDSINYIRYLPDQYKLSASI